MNHAKKEETKEARTNARMGNMDNDEMPDYYTYNNYGK
jgi:hypothetical protein